MHHHQSSLHNRMTHNVIAVINFLALSGLCLPHLITLSLFLFFLECLIESLQWWVLLLTLSSHISCSAFNNYYWFCSGLFWMLQKSSSWSQLLQTLPSSNHFASMIITLEVLILRTRLSIKMAEIPEYWSKCLLGYRHK